MNSRKASRTVKTLLDSTSDPEAAIHQLRRQKVETKFFHTRTKLLPKSMKKVKVALTQKIVKKIKEAGGEGEKKGELERELGKTKALDHVKLADWTFKTQIFKNEEYLQSKLKELGMPVPLSDEKYEFEGMDKVMNVKCYQDAVKGCRSDLNLFMKKLLHEEVKETVVKEQVPRERKMKAPLSGDKSFFMESLNADDSEASESADDTDRSVTEGFDGRVAFTDDEEEEAAYGGYLDSDNSDTETTDNKPKKKKNRLGQMARRRLAEKMYGKEAKHIKTGGLTVQQREELRKQKSQQRKERNARIKKEVSKRNNSNNNNSITSISNNNNNNNIINNNTESKPVKIDPKMHPSWAAKLQQQAKIQQASFQGQKIKFDD